MLSQYLFTNTLLIGEGANPQTVASLKNITQADPAVKKVVRVLTLYFSPQEVLLNLEIQFQQNLSTEKLAVAVERLEKQIRQEHPEIKQIFVEAKSLSASSASQKEAVGN